MLPPGAAVETIWVVYVIRNSASHRAWQFSCQSFINLVRHQVPSLSVGDERGAHFSLPPDLTLLGGLPLELLVTVSRACTPPSTAQRGAHIPNLPPSQKPAGPPGKVTTWRAHEETKKEEI